MPKKVKGRPSDMTPDRTTQSLETLTITPCLCQGMGLTQQKKLLGLTRDTLEILGTVESDTHFCGSLGDLLQIVTAPRDSLLAR